MKDRGAWKKWAAAAAASLVLIWVYWTFVLGWWRDPVDFDALERGIADAEAQAAAALDVAYTAEDAAAVTAEFEAALQQFGMPSFPDVDEGDFRDLCPYFERRLREEVPGAAEWSCSKGGKTVTDLGGGLLLVEQEMRLSVRTVGFREALDVVFAWNRLPNTVIRSASLSQAVNDEGVCGLPAVDAAEPDGTESDAAEPGGTEPGDTEPGGTEPGDIEPETPETGASEPGLPELGPQPGEEGEHADTAPELPAFARPREVLVSHIASGGAVTPWAFLAVNPCQAKIEMNISLYGRDNLPPDAN